MGIVASREQRARARSRSARMDRAIAARDASDPGRVARHKRIKANVAETRKALRTKRSALQALESADRRVAAAVRQLLDEGLTIRRVGEICDLPTSTVSRLGQLTYAPKATPTQAE